MTKSLWIATLLAGGLVACEGGVIVLDGDVAGGSAEALDEGTDPYGTEVDYRGDREGRDDADAGRERGDGDDPPTRERGDDAGTRDIDDEERRRRAAEEERRRRAAEEERRRAAEEERRREAAGEDDEDTGAPERGDGGESRG